MYDQGTGFIDIHSHFLPGLDDGPESVEQCVAAARAYQEIGVARVIATPHHIEGTRWACSTEDILKKVQQIEQELASADIDLQILPGMEISLTDRLCREFNTTGLQSLGRTRFFLVECSLGATMTDPAVMSLHKLCEREDCTFVLAHPERCTAFQENPEFVRQLVNQGMLVQINIGSVTGSSGKKAQNTAFGFFRSGSVHFLATDSHARGNRMPPDKEQMRQLTELLGHETITKAFRDNPACMLEGKAVTPLQREITGSKDHGFAHVLHGLTESLKQIFRFQRKLSRIS